MQNWMLIAGLLLNLAFVWAAPAPQLAVTENEAVIEFPDRITFSFKSQSDVEIERVILEYGVVNQLTCGDVIAKAFPETTPGKAVAAQWTWEMRQSGSEPPGAQVWWRWRAFDTAGGEHLTEKQTVTWLDGQHTWQTKSGEAINLHWYAGNQSFANTLHTAAVQSLADLGEATGLKPDSPIDLYIYANTDDMREAILYEPGWTGGLAYPEYNIVLIGIAPSDMGWGERAQAHELTHVLVGHLTFSCLGNIPTWLNEGLAVYGEGGLDETNARQLREAIVANTLMPVRSLSGGFAEDPGRAYLSYSQSYSLVNFLIDEYGRDKMLDLLRALRDSATVDEALEHTYGFNIEGFEDAWRAKIGAEPRSPDSSAAAATPTPTRVPTLAPISGVPLSVTTRPTPAPTPSAVACPDAGCDTPTVPPIAFTPPRVGGQESSPFPFFLGGLVALCLCMACCVALGGVAAKILIGRRRQNG